ncbi:hypothetical protein E2562_014221 [Oryza meyeriana var. granulata]|uniref:DUF1618 domain-containing protein n=1 Tax=Oryza meyeriana var. granulata TaxID=110450 RepID=A0A6G1BKX8_9ORYZ|nr:hypothetical protein E2562_014221 [Oryza meyeriana var. granulata]
MDSHGVVAVNGTICWINYYVGLIFCDVFEDSPELRFVRFPIKTTPDSLSFLPSSRSVGVSNGMIRLIDVNNCGRKTSGFTITTWTLGTDKE